MVFAMDDDTLRLLLGNIKDVRQAYRSIQAKIDALAARLRRIDGEGEGEGEGETESHASPSALEQLDRRLARIERHIGLPEA